MFKVLENTVTAKFTLSAAGPVIVGSKGSNELDPILPDATFLMGNNGEEAAFVIPGSTIKGVIRSRYCEKTGKKDNDYSVKALFGKAESNNSQRSKISFHDAYADMGTIKAGIRHFTSINSINHNPVKSSLRNIQAVEKGDFYGGFKAINCTSQEIYTILQILDEVNSGLVKFGGQKSRGFGTMEISSFDLVENQGFDENLRAKDENLYNSLEEALKAYSERVKK